MFSIYSRRKKTFFDQKPNANIALEFNNPILDADHTTRVFSLSVNLPSSVKNDGMLSHAYRFDDAQPRTVETVDILVENAPICAVNLSLNSINNDGYAATLKNNERLLLDKLNDLKLSDVLPTFTMPSVRKVYDEWRIHIEDLPLDQNGEYWRIRIGNTDFEAYPNHDPYSRLTTDINAVYPNLCRPRPELGYLTLRSPNTIDLNTQNLANITVTHRPHTATIRPPQYILFLNDPDPQQGYIEWAVKIGNDSFEFNSNDINVCLKFHNAINAKYPNLSIYDPQNEYDRILVLRPLSTDIGTLVNATFVNGDYSNVVPTGTIRTYAEYEAEIVSSFVEDNYEANDLPFILPLVANPLFYEGKIAYKGFVNEVSGIIENGILPSLTKDTETSTLVPFVRYAYILEQIGFKIGKTIKGDFTYDQEFKRLWVENSQSIDKPCEWKNLRGQTFYLNSYNSVVKLSDHVPDISAKEFINQLCATFGQCYKVGTDSITFEYKRHRYNKPSRQWTPKIVAGTESTEWVEKKGFRIQTAADNNDKATPSNAFTIGAGKDIVSLPVGIVAVGNSTYTDVFGVKKTVFCPQVHRRGNEKTDVMRLVFDRGMREGIRFATPGNTYRGTNVGDWTLYAEDLYNRFLKHIVQLAHSDIITATAFLSADDVRDFERGEFCRILAHTEDRGSFIALIETLQFKAYADTRLDFATLTLRKIY